MDVIVLVGMNIGKLGMLVVNFVVFLWLFDGILIDNEFVLDGEFVLYIFIVCFCCEYFIEVYR